MASRAIFKYNSVSVVAEDSAALKTIGYGAKLLATITSVPREKKVNANACAGLKEEAEAGGVLSPLVGAVPQISSSSSSSGTLKYIETMDEKVGNKPGSATLSPATTILGPRSGAGAAAVVGAESVTRREYFRGVVEDAPLLLLDEEAYYLATQKLISVVDGTNDKDVTAATLWKAFVHKNANFPVKYKVFKYFKDKGMVVKTGINFGVDYAVYKASPTLCHAELCVLIVDALPQDCGSRKGSSDSSSSSISKRSLLQDEQVGWTHMCTLTRVIPDVMKTLMLCYVMPSGPGRNTRWACKPPTLQEATHAAQEVKSIQFKIKEREKEKSAAATAAAATVATASLQKAKAVGIPKLKWTEAIAIAANMTIATTTNKAEEHEKSDQRNEKQAEKEEEKAEETIDDEEGEEGEDEEDESDKDESLSIREALAAAERLAVNASETYATEYRRYVSSTAYLNNIFPDFTTDHSPSDVETDYDSATAGMDKEAFRSNKKRRMELEIEEGDAADDDAADDDDEEEEEDEQQQQQQRKDDEEIGEKVDFSHPATTYKSISFTSARCLDNMTVRPTTLMIRRLSAVQSLYETVGDIYAGYQAKTDLRRARANQQSIAKKRAVRRDPLEVRNKDPSKKDVSLYSHGEAAAAPAAGAGAGAGASPSRAGVSAGELKDSDYSNSNSNRSGEKRGLSTGTVKGAKVSSNKKQRRADALLLGGGEEEVAEVSVGPAKTKFVFSFASSP